MASPFDPWAGLRDVTPGALPAMQRPQTQRSPFGYSSGNPSGILGLISQAAGLPTRQEALVGRANEWQAEGFKALQQRLNAGMNPQRAIMDVLSSPEGRDWIANPGSSPLDDMTGFIEKMGMGPEKNVIVRPGEALVGESSGDVAYERQTTETQQFLEMADIANLDDDTLQELAKSQLIAKQTGDLTQTEKASLELYKMGIITYETMQKWNAGMIALSPDRDIAGNIRGWIITDVTSGNGTYKPLGGEPGDQPASPDAAAPLPEQDQPGQSLGKLKNRADVVRGAGPAGYLAENIGGPLSNVVSGVSSGEYGIQRAGLKAILKDAMDLQSLGKGQMNKQELGVIKLMVDHLGIMGSPIETTKDLIQWNGWIDNHIISAQKDIENPRMSTEAIGKAELWLQGLRHAKDNLPTVQELQDILPVLEQEEPALNQFIKDVLSQFPDAMRGVTEEVEGIVGEPATGGLKSYPNAAAARKGYDNEEFEIGDRIIVNGKEVPVTADDEEAQ